MPRFSETVREHAMSPLGRETLPDPTGTGVAGQPGRGPYLVVQIVVENQTIVRSAFQCHNCGVTVAAGSILMELIDGLTLDECRSLTAERVTAALDGLPPDKVHCAEMAVLALHGAINDVTGGTAPV